MYKQAVAAHYSTLNMIGFKRNFDMNNIYIPLTMHIDREARTNCKPDQEMEKLNARQLKAEDLIELPHKVVVVLGEPAWEKPRCSITWH